MSESLIEYIDRNIDSLKAYIIKYFKDIERIPVIAKDIIPVINQYVYDTYHEKLPEASIKRLAYDIILDVNFAVKELVTKIQNARYDQTKTGVSHKLITLAVRNKTFYTLDQLIKKIDNMRLLTKIDQDELYKEYVDTYERYKIYRSYETTKTTQSNEPPKLPTPKKSTPRKKFKNQIQSTYKNITTFRKI